MTLLIGLLCTILCTLPFVKGIPFQQQSLLREVFEAIGEDPSLLDPITSQLDDQTIARIDNSYTVDNSSECLGCIRVINFGNEFINLPGPGYPMWRLTIIQTCKQILNGRGADGDLVCAGICDNYGPHLFDIFRAREFEGREVCEYNNKCDRPEVYDPPAIVQKPQLKKSGVAPDIPEDAIKIAVLTDVHVEHNYNEGAAVDCNVWVCCRDDVTGTGSARRWGEFECNTAPETLEVFLDQVADMSPDIVLYGGDGPPNALWDETEENMLSMNSWIAKSFTERLPGVKVYPTMGNHDVYPGNMYYVPREETQTHNIHYGEDWTIAAEFGPEEIETINYSGYYTKEVVPGLRILSYNSNYGFTDTWYNLLSQYEDVIPTMRQWMVDTLESARANGEKVIVLGHHSLGGGGNIVEDGIFMTQLFIDYSDVIVLQPVGHSHSNEFRLIIDENGEAKGTIFVTGSITTYSYTNPTVTVFYLDPTTFTLLDFDHFYNRIDEQTSEEIPQLELMYRASEEYQLTDLSPASWLDLSFRFEEDDDLFLSYMDNKDSRFTPGGISCDDNCKHNALCGIRNTDYVSYRRCQNEF